MLCSGRVYYDLLEERDAQGIDDVYLAARRAVLSLPGPDHGERADALLSNAEIVWCQEEPKNQGGWTFMMTPTSNGCWGRIGAKTKRARYVGRAAAASPATGLASQHKAQQEALVNDALTSQG